MPHSFFRNGNRDVEYSGCVVHVAGQSLMQNQVKGIIFTAVPLSYHQIDSQYQAKSWNSDRKDLRMLARQVFTDLHQRKLAHQIQEAS